MFITSTFALLRAVSAANEGTTFSHCKLGLNYCSQTSKKLPEPLAHLLVATTITLEIQSSTFSKHGSILLHNSFD